MVGRVDGQVNLDHESRDLVGLRILLLALPVAAVLAVVLLLPHVLAPGAPLVGALVPLLLVLIAMVVVYAFILGVTRTSLPGALLRATGAGALWASKTAARGVVAGTRATAGLGTSRGLSHQVAVRRFRLRQLDGSLVACAQLGDLVGDEIRHGDVLRLSGHRRKNGLFVVRAAEVLAAPSGPVVSVVTTRRAVGFRLVGALDRMAGALGVLVLVVAVVLALRAL